MAAAATSIHIQPVKTSSERHNTREAFLDYIKAELSSANEQHVTDSIANRLETIKQLYKASTGQNMQKKATPIREGVLVIGENTTMDQLKDFAGKCEERYGIKAFQIYIHRDEGHETTEGWKTNHHAHIVFDWTDHKGKSCKLNPADMSEMQTLLAMCLGMERGESSDRKHLNSIQFKNKAEQQRHKELQEAIKQAQEELRTIEAKKSTRKAISKGAEKITDLLGATRNDKEKEGLKTALKSVEDENERLRAGVMQNYEVAEKRKDKIRQLEQENATLKEQVSKARGIIQNITKEVSSFFGIDAIRERIPTLAKLLHPDPDRSKSRGM